MQQNWTIIILCYNEADSIEKVCLEVIEVANRLGGGKKEIVIIDDGSTDHSKHIIQGLEERFEMVRGVYCDNNSGLGTVTKIGHEIASFENIYLISGDGEANPQELLKLNVEKLNDDTFYIFKRDNKVGYSWFRHWLTAVNRWVNKLFFGVYIEDINWNKVLRKSQVKQLDLQIKGVLVDSEIVLKLLHLNKNLIELETVSRQRTGGEPTGAKWSSVVKSFIDLFTLWKVIRNFKKG